MIRFLKIAGLFCIYCALIALSCVSEAPGQGMEPGASGGRGPSESEMVLLLVKGLADNANSKRRPGLSSEQAAAVLPILKDWKNKLSANVSLDGASYSAKISAALTEEQRAYRPETPRGNPSGQTMGSVQGVPGGPLGGPPPNGAMQGPPGGGPAGNIGGRVSGLLVELIMELETLGGA